MVLTEQLYTDKNQVFYHGTLAKSEDSDISKANFPWYFITPNFMYALRYARKFEETFGQIRKFNISRDINIFMAENDSDLNNLKNYLKLPEDEWLKLQDTLLNKDWTKLGEAERTKIADAIKELKYDGFFNYEDADETDKTYQFSEYYTKAPSIGLFDKSVLTQIGILKHDDFESESETYKEVHAKEKKYAQKELDNLLVNSTMDPDAIYEWVFQRCPTLEIDELYEDEDNEDFEDLFDSIYKSSARLREASSKELESLIKKVNKALHDWAKDKQVFASKKEGHNAAEFELTCDTKGDGTYISITVPKTLGYFPLNKSLLDFIDLLDSDEKLNSLKVDAEQAWTLYTGQSAATSHKWDDKDCIEVALCSIPGIWSDPKSNEVQKEFLERILEIIG